MRPMTVARLIDLLSEYPEDAIVHVMSQESYPFENTVAGVVARSEFMDEDEELEDGQELNCTDMSTGESKTLKGGGKTTDVFILEGSQLRYGSKEAWNVCRK